MSRSGCCGGQRREVCEEELFLLLKEVIFDSELTNLPPTQRWYTFIPQLRRQAFGSLQNNILPRVQDKAFQVPEDELEGNDVDAWKVANNKKKAQIIEFNENPGEQGLVLGLSTIFVQPVDSLSLELQSLDANGGAMRELTDQHASGPVERCLRAFAAGEPAPWPPRRMHSIRFLCTAR